MGKNNQYAEGLEFAIDILIEGLKVNVPTLDRAHHTPNVPPEDVAYLRACVRTYADTAARVRGELDEVNGFDVKARIALHRAFKQAQAEANELVLKMVTLSDKPVEAKAVAEELELKQRQADSLIVRAAIAAPAPRSTSLMN